MYIVVYKVKTHLDKLEKIQSKIKRKKLRNMSTNSLLKKMVLERFDEHLPFFKVKYDFNVFCYSKFHDFENLYTLHSMIRVAVFLELVVLLKLASMSLRFVILLSLRGVENEIINSAGNTPDIVEKHDNGNINNIATYKGERLESKFVSSNVINLSRRNLSEAEISLLSKGLKFVPTANKIDRAKLKTELEEYGRKLRLMWHFRNDEKPFSYEKFRPKSTFNPRNKDTVIETYLSSLEERLLDIDISSKRFNNLTKEERNALYNLRDDPTIIIKGADKGSEVVLWDRDDYLKEASKQLEDKDVYEEVQNDPSTLINTIMRALEKIRIRGDLSNDTLNYFLVKDPKFARFYLLPKIHKRLHNVPGRPVISNCGFYTENISSFLDHHLQPIAQKVNSFIKDTNHFLRKIKSLGQLPEGAILCTIDVVGLYPNIPHEEGLASLRKFLDARTEKKVTTEIY